jgi:hypothetical protein
MFRLDPTIILQGVLDDLTNFLNGPLQSIKRQSVPLMRSNPWKATPQEELDAVDRVSALHKG